MLKASWVEGRIPNIDIRLPWPLVAACHVSRFSQLFALRSVSAEGLAERARHALRVRGHKTTAVNDAA